MEIARHLDGEIISIDSRQIYRHLDIGTAKPTAAMQAKIPHWCIDIADPTDRFTLGEYLKAARSAIDDIRSRGKRAIVAGGSGQHMRALLEGWLIPPVEEDAELRRSLESQPTPFLHEQLQAVDPWQPNGSVRPTPGGSSGRWKSINSPADRFLSGKRSECPSHIKQSHPTST